jgi:uncharacterized protein (DUF362 family)
MRPLFRVFLYVSLPALVMADFYIWSQVPVEHTPYRMLSDFESPSSDKNSTVSIIRSDNTNLSNPCALDQTLDYEQVAQMVNEAVRLAGGLENHLGENDRKIVIKPNLVESAPNGNGVDTDWRVVKALVLILYGIKPEFEIIVAEGAGGWAVLDSTPFAPDWLKNQGDGYEVTGYKEMIESLQDDPEYPDLNLEWVDLNYDETVETPVPEPRLTELQSVFFLPKTIVEADFLISVPVLKVHGTGITVGLKNYVGLLPGMVYGWSKDNGYNNNGIGLDHTPGVLQENFVDIVRTAGCDFVVVDGIVGKERTKYASGLSKRRNMIIAGEDVVSVDVVCAHLMDINPDDVEHICVAAYCGLGQNNLEHIEVAGSTIEESKTKFIKASSHMDADLKNTSYPYYGQSNRVWLLKGPYTGLEMDADSLGGEAEAAPRPGLDGWSEPVYFFDNLIDPAAFFPNSTEDCMYYAFTNLKSTQESSAQLWVGSRQDMTVWINGEQVYSYRGLRGQGHRLPNEVLEIDIPAGISRLLVKVSQRSERSEFSLNICEVQTNSSYSGNRLAGLEFLPEVSLSEITCDLNGDGGVNILDVIFFLLAMRDNPDDSGLDWNGDGTSTVADAVALLSDIIQGKCPE